MQYEGPGFPITSYAIISAYTRKPGISIRCMRYVKEDARSSPPGCGFATNYPAVWSFWMSL